MAATSRIGVLLLLAACGGGDRTGKADTSAMATPPADTAAMAVAPAGAPAESAATPAASPADTASGKAAAKPAAASKDTGKAAAKTTPRPATGAQDTTKPAAKPAAAAAKPAAGGAHSPQQVALGDSIFHGQVAGGTCTACHGQDAKGTAIAPDLTDQQWINGDGSYDFIVHTVTTGVPQPKQHPAPMPPKGGATLTDDQVKAVAAYVYSLSHKS